MKKFVVTILTVVCVVGVQTVNASLMSVSGPASTGTGPYTAPAIISAPQYVLEDNVTNTGMQGFNEAQGVVTTVAHVIDGGGSIAIGTKVDSHMIFLNTPGNGITHHVNVVWTFDGIILGVMSDKPGNFEANSTFELGAPGSNYTIGPVDQVAPYSARGLELTGNNADSYVISGNQITVNMHVSEPGDWIRVVTASNVPDGGVTAGLMGLGLLALGYGARKKK